MTILDELVFPGLLRPNALWTEEPWMRLPNLSNLAAGISLRIPAIASDREVGERR
jgi:hypothetical protein